MRGPLPTYGFTTWAAAIHAAHVAASARGVRYQVRLVARISGRFWYVGPVGAPPCWGAE